MCTQDTKTHNLIALYKEVMWESLLSLCVCLFDAEGHMSVTYTRLYLSVKTTSSMQAGMVILIMSAVKLWSFLDIYVVEHAESRRQSFKRHTNYKHEEPNYMIRTAGDDLSWSDDFSIDSGNVMYNLYHCRQRSLN